MLFLALLSLASDLTAGIMIRPGFKLGGGVANNFGQDTYQQRWQVSLQAGLFVELYLRNRLSAQAELNFVRKGSVYRLDSDGLEYVERYLFDYLELPVLVKYYFASVKRLNFYVYAGPSVALNLKARLRVTFDDLEETVVVDNLQGTDLLLNGGAGAAISLKPGSFILEARYSHGLKSVATEPGADIRNKSLLLLAGFKF
ncbi:MAG: porin family protein [Candidatus Saccharicenans sp.]|nr:PorT family protein [Candidatus Saccharicenans sp.]MDH7574399.1 porin family protein [Candidatus Saccharicenans sp.]